MSMRQAGRVVAIIPARFGAQRLPGKPLVEIAGKPMVQWVYERARSARTIEHTIVATDDRRVVDAVRAFGGEVVMTPERLQSGTDRVAYAARELTDTDIVVNVQGDEPLIAPAMIDEAVEVVQKNPDVVMGTLVRTLDRTDDLTNPSVVKAVLDGNGYCLYFSRSPIPFGRDYNQDAWIRHHAYYKHIGLYVYRRDFLLEYAGLSPTPLELMEKLEQLRVLEHGFRIKARVTEHDSIPVDTPADLERVRSMMQTVT
jgi:3-deoxy-manno-octulosonate cytidylyltransferase (CMP-KDO synthetase)